MCNSPHTIQNHIISYYSCEFVRLKKLALAFSHIFHPPVPVFCLLFILKHFSYHSPIIITSAIADDENKTKFCRFCSHTWDRSVFTIRRSQRIHIFLANGEICAAVIIFSLRPPPSSLQFYFLFSHSFILINFYLPQNTFSQFKIFE